MEKSTADTKNKPTNYYALLKNNLQKVYSGLDDNELSILCRETVFAPAQYTFTMNKRPVSIASVRETTANFIERDKSAKDFIPYSLDSAIADLIEKSNCETSSINEYYRWISLTSELVKNVADGIVTDEDVSLRREFITMSFDREAEILLCLALYQSANNPQNNEKVELLKFKLARLREMRSIVRNTSSRSNSQYRLNAEELNIIYNYCANLLSQKPNLTTNINLKLKLNINHNTEDEQDENFSYYDYLRDTILQMMRTVEEHYASAERLNDAEKQTSQQYVGNASRSSYENDRG